MHFMPILWLLILIKNSFALHIQLAPCMTYLCLFNQQVQQCSVPPRCSRRCWDRGCGVRRLWTMFRLIDVIWFWHVFGVLGTTYSAESLLWTLWLTKRVLLSVRLYCHSSERLKFELRAMTRDDAKTSFSYEYSVILLNLRSIRFPDHLLICRTYEII